MSVTVECTVCGESVGKMGIGRHGKMHRSQFMEAYGRPPDTYQEMRDRWPFDADCTDDAQQTITSYE